MPSMGREPALGMGTTQVWENTRAETEEMEELEMWEQQEQLWETQ